MADIAKAHLVLGTRDVDRARRQVFGALAAAGFEVTRRSGGADGFRLTGVRGGHGAAVLAASTFLSWFGFFSRSRVDARCRRDLDGGDELHLYLGVGSLRELDDGDEVNWVTRGVGEIIGDGLQARRVLHRVVTALEEGVEAPPEAARPLTKEERRAELKARIRAGNRRRTIGIVMGLVVLVALAVLRWLTGR